MSRVNGQWGQNRKDLFLEIGAQGRLLLFIEVAPANETDALGLQFWLDYFAEYGCVPLLKPVSLDADSGEHLLWAQARARGNGKAGCDSTLQASHANHEKLIEIRGKNAQKCNAFEQKQAWVFGHFEHALVECQPAHFAV